MSLLRIILWGLLFYLAWKTLKNIFNALSGIKINNAKKAEPINHRDYKSKIKKEDVVDAEFVDITETKTEKPKE